MPKKLTQEEFINRLENIYGTKYSYNSIVYINSGKKVKLTCPKHGTVLAIAHRLLHGDGCPLCGKESRRVANKYTTELFIEKALCVHKDNLDDYSEVEYVDSSKPVKIFCIVHKSFYFQKPVYHLGGSRCPKCSGRKKLTTIEFIDKSIKSHSIEYGYDKVLYKNSATAVTIYCPVHNGYFEQQAGIHISGCDCPVCFRKDSLGNDGFIKRAIEVHGDKYLYDKVNYINGSVNVDIYCKKHSYYFSQKPETHINSKCGCPVCATEGKSNTEVFIYNLLDESSIDYKFQYSFKNCKHKSKLLFDFAVFKDKDLFGLIEYDGQHHYFPVKFGGISEEQAEENFKQTKKRDKIKNNYCRDNNIPLLRIPYTEENIEDSIMKWLEENNY